MIRLYAAVAPWEIIRGHIRDLRPSWLLEELGVPYERIVLDPMKGETRTLDHKARSLFGKIPAIQDGDFTLFESAAVVGYVAQKYGRLIPPPGTKERALYEQWVFCAVTNIEPQNSRLLSCDHFRDPGLVTTEIRALAVSALRTYLVILDERLSRVDYILGYQFSAADIMLTTSLTYVHQAGELEKYPHVKAYVSRMQARPAHQKARAMNGLA